MSLSQHDRLPVLLLTGFLGSGKTSLLNGLLREPAFADTAVVVNEFGDIGLDHLLVASAKESIVLLDAGCLCCAVIDSLPETLADLFARRARGETPSFARVVIETTGLADPAPILRALMRDPIISHFYKVQGVMTVVDGLLGLEQLDRENEAVAQAAIADHLVIAKTDLTDDRPDPRLVARLDWLNPHAALVCPQGGVAELAERLAGETTQPWVLANPALFMNPDEAAEHVGHGPEAHDHHHHAEAERHDATVLSHAFWLDAPTTWPALADFIDALRARYGRDLLRCKGLIAVEGVAGPVVLHGVETVFDTQAQPAWPDADHRSRLVLIGRGLDAAALSRAVAALAA